MFAISRYSGKPIKIDKLKKIILGNPFYIGIMRYGEELTKESTKPSSQKNYSIKSKNK